MIQLSCQKSISITSTAIRISQSVLLGVLPLMNGHYSHVRHSHHTTADEITRRIYGLRRLVGDDVLAMHIARTVAAIAHTLVSLSKES